MPTRRDVDIAHFPGGELIAAGLRDLAEGIESVPALLVSMASRRLRGLGLEVPLPLQNAELRLYALLADEDSDTAHGRYNAFVRRLVSFTRAAQCAGEKADQQFADPGRHNEMESSDSSRPAVYSTPQRQM